MSRFVQLHLLTSYPPANLNRDDTGRPKTALVGEALRLRISSQSLKRAWRTSETFQEALAGHIGTRTKRMGGEILALLRERGIAEKTAREWARAMAGQFGKIKSEKKTEHNEDLEIEQLAHFGPEEREAVIALAGVCAERGSGPSTEELDLLRKPARAADIVMFGRMLADAPAYNVEAAIQVAHAFTVHKAAVEDDYFSAVDDLNDGREDAGAGHIGERGYGAGVFYLYLCINRELLQENLGGDAELTGRALEALLHAVTKVAPTGMQNSFASRAYAAFALAEKGDQQPRSLAQAFLKPVRAREDWSLLDAAVGALDRRCENFDQVYGACATGRYRFNVETGEGSLQGLTDFVKGV
ncbi:type I-E CRISPR-associated protein Cas7/Cse4/CasC [Immundisolibacter sp.]|uniref:type I-E CRISPR-associated protein Cas7/Cse4/CasC n=1 Tax=Immundisolibacter sp. TaxID=1934948 RepID=UPI0035641F96